MKVQISKINYNLAVGAEEPVSYEIGDENGNPICLVHVKDWKQIFPLQTEGIFFIEQCMLVAIAQMWFRL